MAAATTTRVPINATIELRNGDAWVRLSINLAEPFVGGNVARIAPDVQVELEGSDEASAAYSNVNWLSGVASGAFYAYRTLKAPRQVVVISELVGRLGAGDIGVLAFAAARLVADSLHLELPLVELDGWRIASLAASANGTGSN